MVTVERQGIVVFGINNDGKGSNIGMEGTKDGIDEQGASKSLSMESRINGQTTDSDGWNRRIPRQFLFNIVRQLSDGNLGGGKRVKTGDMFRLIANRNIACSHAAANVLRNLCSEIPV